MSVLLLGLVAQADSVSNYAAMGAVGEFRGKFSRLKVKLTYIGIQHYFLAVRTWVLSPSFRTSNGSGS